MLRKGAAFCGTCRAAGIEGTVAVNLSIKSLADVNLAERVTEIVRGFGVEPRAMVLEVTESAATTDVSKALENLSRLRMNRFGLSIDDYGTGYSSMQQLTRIPFAEREVSTSRTVSRGSSSLTVPIPVMTAQARARQEGPSRRASGPVIHWLRL